MRSSSGSVEVTAYLNGEYLPLEAARVSVLDRGFLFGDGVYEVIPVYAGRPFRLGPHLDRLERSLAETRIRNPHARDEWEVILNGLIARGGGDALALYLQVTRGVAKRDHAFPEDVTPTVFAMVNVMPSLPEGLLEHGASAVVRDDLRWHRCDIKAITLLANVLMRQSAADEGATEAILVRDGLVTEGAATNLFMVRKGVIVTPPKGPLLLPGITRDFVLELAHTEGLRCQERDIPEAELREADEVWLTSSTKEVLPVTTLDRAPVGDGRPGPMWHRVYRLFQDHKRSLVGPASRSST